MDEHPDTSRQPEVVDPRAKAREWFRRAAPVLRDVNAAIEQQDALRQTRDVLMDRAGELVQKADEALSRVTAIEGTVVEQDERDATAAAGAAEGAPTEPQPRVQATTASSHRPHWTRERLVRMASAAATEAVRPHRPWLTRRVQVRIGAAIAALAALLLVRRLRR